MIAKIISINTTELRINHHNDALWLTYLIAANLDLV